MVEKALPTGASLQSSNRGKIYFFVPFTSCPPW